MTNRPTNFDSFIGQKHLIDNLRVIVGGAKYREETAPHMLFMGPAGLGKTSVANLIASEMGTQMIPALGTMLKKPADIAALIMGLCEGDVLFIDEVHAMPRAVYETLYTAVEDFHLDIMVGTKGSPRPVRINLPHFTLVGATTHPGGISGPLRDRFGFVGKLTFYEPPELREILYQAAGRDNIALHLDAAELLAGAARGTPRVALRLYERSRDVAQSRVTNRQVIDEATAEAALKLSGTDHLGLDETDRAVLRELATSNEAVGLSTLAATLGEEPSTIENMVEPFLLRMGLIVRTPQGRVVTQKGYDYWRRTH